MKTASFLFGWSFGELESLSQIYNMMVKRPVVIGDEFIIDGHFHSKRDVILGPLVFDRP